MNLEWVLLNKGWLDREWTQNPISVQTLSKPCRMSVHKNKKYKVCPIKYRVCPKYVEILSNSKVLGQRLDWKIQELSTYCPITNYQEKPIFYSGQCLEKHWTWTNIGLGQTVDKYKICYVLKQFISLVDKLWTNIGLGQILDNDKIFKS